MFADEIIAGMAASSASFQADTLDFLGVASNYAISTGVAGLGLAWRACVELISTLTQLAAG